jgi:hypothetical protein
MYGRHIKRTEHRLMKVFFRVHLRLRQLVIPIQKVSKTMKSDEFRPINMLPVYEKAMESVVKDQLSAFIDENNILIEQQSGFWKSHACSAALPKTKRHKNYKADQNFKLKIIINVLLLNKLC